MKWQIQLQESNEFKRWAIWVLQCTREETRRRIEDTENKTKEAKETKNSIKESKKVE